MNAAFVIPAALAAAGVAMWAREAAPINGRRSTPPAGPRPVIDGLQAAVAVQAGGGAAPDAAPPEPQTDVLVLLSRRRHDLADKAQPDADEAYREWMRTLDDILEAELALDVLTRKGRS